MYVTGAIRNDKCPKTLARNDNLRQFSPYCFRFVLTEKRTWGNAKLDCENAFGDPVYIFSEMDQNFMARSWQVICLCVSLKNSFN